MKRSPTDNESAPKKKKRKKAIMRYWPPAKDGEKYGPMEHQKLVFFDEMPDAYRIKRVKHMHDLDIVLFLGGTRGGKTACAVARCLKAARNHVGAKIIVGSLNFEHLRSTVIDEYRKLLSVGEGEWNHAWVKKGCYPNKYRKELIIRARQVMPDGTIKKGFSTIKFVNLERFLSLLGQEADIVHIEEPELLQSAGPLETCITRMSNAAIPWKQIILTANPEHLDKWLMDWFQLEQLDPDYEGERKPIGTPCECQYCVKCKGSKKEQILYIDGKCPDCGYVKKTKCPGGQFNKRVIMSDATMNPHVPDSYHADIMSNLSDDGKKKFGQGLVVNHKAGKIYVNYTKANRLTRDREIDPERPLIWTLDFNNRPQCSVICQIQSEEGLEHVYALDEIVKWNATPTTIARIFVERFKPLRLRQPVRIYGDPAGFNGAVEGQSMHSFQELIEVLEKEGGFRTELVVRKVKYKRALRYDSVNAMLDDGQGLQRLHFNERCRHLLVSVDKVKWDKTGKKEDEREDHRARLKGRDGELHWELTHPMAALGYLIVHEFPLHQEDGAVPFFLNPSTGYITEIRDGRLVDVDVRPSDEELMRMEDEMRDEYAAIDSDLYDDRDRQLTEFRNQTHGNYLRSRGLLNLRRH